MIQEAKTISPEQRAGILFICKKLFPEVRYITVLNYAYIQPVGTFFSFVDTPSTVVLENILYPWYELCVSVLPSKMNEVVKNKMDIDDFLYETVQTSNIHPADYLIKFWQNQKS